jgi:hypothetical protein
MRTTWWLWLMFLAGLGTVLWAGEEEIPQSIRDGLWGCQTAGPEGYVFLDRADGNSSLPSRILREVGRNIVTVPVNNELLKQKKSEGTWWDYVPGLVPDRQSVIRYDWPDALTYHDSVSELKPIPTGEQLAWADTLPERWVLPLPDGFSLIAGGRAKARIHPCEFGIFGRTTSRVQVGQFAIPDKPPSGGITVYVSWYPKPLDREDLLFEYMSVANVRGIDRKSGTIELESEGPHVVALMKHERSSMNYRAAWPSGNFVVYIEMPKRHWKAMVPRYLEKYPSDWTRKWDLDLNAMMLRRLDRAVQLMTENIEGPLEYLRYSFQRYSFDEGYRYAMRVSLTGDLYTFHHDAVKRIFDDWVKGPPDRLRLSDYRDAMLAHRRELLARVIAERDRVARDGYVQPPSTPGQEPLSEGIRNDKGVASSIVQVHEHS